MEQIEQLKLQDPAAFEQMMEKMYGGMWFCLFAYLKLKCSSDELKSSAGRSINWVR